jgi:predicted metal-dependent HD superfamily phosphohydrolase
VKRPAQPALSLERWNALLRALGAAPDTATFASLRSAYAEQHRAYHTVRHIDECLALCDEYAHLAARAPEVECALWFHDAIYQPTSDENEARSAEWASEFLGRQGVAADSVERVRAHILATRHVASPTDDDSRLVVDIDLSILGAEPQRYDEFERDVRAEYRWVPSALYCHKRAAILQSFLDRQRIYHHQPMFERFEQRARANISRAVNGLFESS